MMKLLDLWIAFHWRVPKWLSPALLPSTRCRRHPDRLVSIGVDMEHGIVIMLDNYRGKITGPLQAIYPVRTSAEVVVGGAQEMGKFMDTIER